MNHRRSPSLFMQVCSHPASPVERILVPLDAGSIRKFALQRNHGSRLVCLEIKRDEDGKY